MEEYLSWIAGYWKICNLQRFTQNYTWIHYWTHLSLIDQKKCIIAKLNNILKHKLNTLFVLLHCVSNHQICSCTPFPFPKKEAMVPPLLVRKSKWETCSQCCSAACLSIRTQRFIIFRHILKRYDEMIFFSHDSDSVTSR